MTESGRLLRLEWDFERCRFTLRDAATGDDLTAAHGSGTDTRGLARTLYGVERDVYLRAGCVDQAELNQIGEPDAVRHAIEVVMTSAPADGSAAKAVAVLRAARSDAVGLNRARTNPLPEAEAEAALLQQPPRRGGGRAQPRSSGPRPGETPRSPGPTRRRRRCTGWSRSATTCAPTSCAAG